MWPFTKTLTKFQRGIDHAKECMANGKADDLLQEIEVAKTLGDYDDFDRGAEKALREKGLI